MVFLGIFVLKGRSNPTYNTKKKMILVDTLPNFWLSNESPIIFGLVNTLSVFSTNYWFNSISTLTAIISSIGIVLFLIKLIFYTKVKLDKDWTEKKLEKQKTAPQELVRMRKKMRKIVSFKKL